MRFNIDTPEKLKTFEKTVKVVRPIKTTKDKYREAVQTLNDVYRSDKNKNYGSRLFKATNRVNKLMKELLDDN